MHVNYFKHLSCVLVSNTAIYGPNSQASCTSCSVVVHSPLLVFLMSAEESNVKLAPAPCAYSDKIVLLWIPLSFSEGVRVGAGN